MTNGKDMSCSNTSRNAPVENLIAIHICMLEGKLSADLECKQPPNWGSRNDNTRIAKK